MYCNKFCFHIYTDVIDSAPPWRKGDNNLQMRGEIWSNLWNCLRMRAKSRDSRGDLWEGHHVRDDLWGGHHVRDDLWGGHHERDDLWGGHHERANLWQRSNADDLLGGLNMRYQWQGL